MNTMHKLAAAGTAVALMASATPAFAHGSNLGLAMNMKMHGDARYDSECLAIAVETHHEAKVDAYAEYRADVAADLTTRTNALVAANAIEDDEDRMAAVKAAWTAYFNATADARAELKADIKTANQTFATAKANCSIDSDDDDDEDEDHGSGSLVKGWNGKDRGWHRGWFKHGRRDH